MNYIWDVYLQALAQEIPFRNILFVPAKEYSPYIEVSFTELNRDRLYEEPIEVNTLYRFIPIFAPLLSPGYDEDWELRNTLFDILLHYLTIMDMRQGMSKHEFYMLFLKYDTLKGAYGEDFSEISYTFSISQRAWVFSCLVKVYEEGTSIELFRNVMKQIYPDSMIYFHTDTKQEILVYIGLEETEIRQKQVLFLCELFLPLDMTIYPYWLHHFGIVDYNVTLKTDAMMLF